VVQQDAHLTARPSVVVHGFPFVTQVVHGRYTHITVTADDIFSTSTTSPDATDASTLVLDLRGVHIPLGKVVSNQVHTVEVDDVTGTVTASFADLAAASNVPGLSLAAGSQANAVTATETVTVLGEKAQASVTATLTTSGHTISAKATAISLGSVKVPADVLSALLSKSGFQIAIPGLPPALKLGEVSVGVGGVVLPLQQSDLVMSR
jgi:hypothetical protein